MFWKIAKKLKYIINRKKITVPKYVHPQGFRLMTSSSHKSSYHTRTGGGLHRRCLWNLSQKLRCRGTAFRICRRWHTLSWSSVGHQRTRVTLSCRLNWLSFPWSHTGVRGFLASWKRILSIFMLSKVVENNMSVELSVFTRILVIVQPARFVSITMAYVWG